MRVIQNEKYIRTRGTIGRTVFFGGFGLLLLGLIISLTDQSIALFPISLLCLVLGLILSQAGGYYIRRFDRGELPHLALARALKGFDDRYTLVNYGTPASHVLLAPDNLYVLVAKPQSGKVVYQNGRWQNPGRSFFNRFFNWASEERLGNPVRDAAAEVARLQRYLSGRLPDVNVEPQPVVVFLHPNVEVDTGASPVPALHVKKLKDWLRSRPKGSLGRDAHSRLSQLLASSPSAKASEA